MKYALVFQELSHLEGVVTCGHQIVIAKSLWELVIDICHGGHLGVVETKQLLTLKRVVSRNRQACGKESC